MVQAVTVMFPDRGRERTPVYMRVIVTRESLEQSLTLLQNLNSGR